MSEYIELTHKLPDKFMSILATGEPGSEPFDQLYRRYMEKCILKKKTLVSLRHQYSSEADIVQLITNELASVDRRMQLAGFRTQPASSVLKKNNHAWIGVLPWLESELAELDARKVDYKPKKASERRQALTTSIDAIKYDYASQRDVQKLLRMAGPRPQPGKRELKKGQEFQYITKKLRAILQSKGKKGSPAGIVNCIKRLQQGREAGIVDKAFAVLDCYQLEYSEEKQAISFIDMYGERVSKSEHSIGNFYRKRLPDELYSDQ